MDSQSSPSTDRGKIADWFTKPNEVQVIKGELYPSWYDQKQAQVHYKDPAGVANQYRFVMKVNGVQSKQVYAENDRLTDGNNVPSVLFYTGNNKDQDQLRTGDVVEVEMQCIDKNIFLYWFTLSQQSQNGPGGGTTPGNPPSNINNNALGYFSEHTVSKKQMTVK